jgi:hypothetical protein
MMSWMLPLMFGYFAYTAPAGLGLYWLISNLAGVVLQYFYLGRKVDWGGMLRFGPPSAPQQQRGGAKALKPVTEPSTSNETPEAESNGASEDQSERAAAVASSGSRRKRHGRRRGKR